ncbi:uncharacterized protein LOC144551267 [Carex rostrata]
MPGIAPRVIEEVKSFQQNGYLHSSSKSSGSSTTKGAAPMSSRSKSSNGPKTVNEVKRKAEILKDNRDYTFLFSDDAEAPHKLSTKNCSQIKFVPSTSQPSSAKHIKEPSRGDLTGPNGISAPSSAKHIKEPSRGHLKGTNNSTTGTSTQRQSHQQHHRMGSTTAGTSTQRRSQQQIERQGTTRQPLPQSNRPKPISNGSHRPSPSTGAKRPPFDDNAIDMIRKMFKYNPKRWAGVDEDDSDMEVGFDVIQKEERRSSKIGKKEDEEQLRLIEEEEKRDRMRKRQKLR